MSPASSTPSSTGAPGLAVLRLRVLLILARQLDDGLVHAPVLLSGRLEDEDVVRVVVDGEPLGGARREVRVRLHRLAERGFKPAAEVGDRRPVVVERLKDDRRAVLELGEDAVDVDRPAERLRAPAEVDRVRLRLEHGPLADEPERREAQRARADQPLDVLE